MLAARLYAPRDLRIEEVPQPNPPKEWVLIKSIAVGICGTDKAFYTGRYPLFKKPLILGHEVVGKVIEGDKDLIGKIVVPEINFSCMTCYTCRQGLYTHCPNRKTLGIDFDGGMAEYFIAPKHVLHVVEDIDVLIATAIEPLAAIINALNSHPIKPAAKVAIIGTGNMAILFSQLLKYMGFEDLVIIARDDSPKKRFFEHLGIEVVSVSAVKEYVAKYTREGLGFDVVIEVSGDPNAIDLAIDVARPRGIIHLKSTPGTPSHANLTWAVVKELQIVCTRCGRFDEFEKAISLLRKGIVKPIITGIVEGLHRAVEAMELALQREHVKVVLKI